MAQADQQVQNASFPVVRTDINDNLAALFSQSSGASAPAVTVAFQPWIDTSASPAVWKVRNAANTAWVTIGTINATTGQFSVGGVTAIANGGTGQTTAAAALTALLPSQAGNTGKGLITDGTAAAWGTIAAGASVQVFTSSGTYTPTAGKTTFLVFATGGGGSAGGTGGAGGGGGGTAIRLYTAAEMGASAVVTVGSGGAASSSSVGNSGGTTSFDPGGTGLTITGIGGGGNSSSTGGAGGGTTNSLFDISGSPGNTSTIANTGFSFWIRGPGFGAMFVSGTGVGVAGTAGIVFILEW